MVFNSQMVVSTAKVSAGVWQALACLPERLTNDELFHVLFRFPLHHMRRMARRLWIFLSTPADPATGSSYHEDDDSDYTYRSGDDDDDGDDSDDGESIFEDHCRLRSSSRHAAIFFSH
uniref:Uncharacterized protein n=1 Tax=Kalanchoe fedtschenkoi TaxID=63787 RepID=A0A7N0THP7_KALFE